VKLISILHPAITGLLSGFIFIYNLEKIGKKKALGILLICFTVSILSGFYWGILSI